MLIHLSLSLQDVKPLIAHEGSMPRSDEELRERLHLAVEEASRACEAGTSEQCASAWDKVEDLCAAHQRREALQRVLRGAPGKEIPANRPDWTRSKAQQAKEGNWRERQGRGPLEGKDLLAELKPTDTGQVEPAKGTLRHAGQLERMLGASVSSLQEAFRPEPGPEERARKKLLDSEIESAVAEAANKCEMGSEHSCEEAWHHVEELSRAREELDSDNVQ